MELKILGKKSIEELDSFPDSFAVRIHMLYPNYNDLLHLIPKERIKVIRQRQRDNFKAITKELKATEFKRVGSKNAPSGFEIVCSKEEVLNFREDKRIEYISVLTDQQPDNEEAKTTEILFAVKARFVIQIENRTKGLQDYEDRILLTKATSGAEAEEKLKKGFGDYEKPYLNPLGELVRWKFEEFIDWYETGYSSLEDMLADENDGIEIFSSLKSRRLTNERIWKRENP